MKIKPVFAWYDLWIGFYWDKDRRQLYILPLPCIGVVITFKPKSPYCWSCRSHQFTPPALMDTTDHYNYNSCYALTREEGGKHPCEIAMKVVGSCDKFKLKEVYDDE